MFFSSRSHYLLKLSRCNKCYCRVRRCTSNAQKDQKPSDAKDDDNHCDDIGPLHKVSNILQMKLYIPKNESKLEREFREKRIEVYQWHHEFWEKHNTSFYKAQKAFVEKTLEEKYANEPTKTTLSAEDMAEFYKKFQNDNREKHRNYNREWYKKNFQLLWCELKTKMNIRLKKKES